MSYQGLEVVGAGASEPGGGDRRAMEDTRHYGKRLISPRESVRRRTDGTCDAAYRATIVKAHTVQGP
jgi:hypothetical protein